MTYIESIHPPQFSNTKTYANRYDLDEIDVFLEGDSSNPMFFGIKELPEILNYGTHNFVLEMLDSSNQPYQLKGDSKILFEFKSINNVVLRSDVYKTNNRNGTAFCFVDVLKDPLRTFKVIDDGVGTLTIVGSLIHNKNTVNPIPKKFQDKMNYRCTFPIDIRKNYRSVLTIEHSFETIPGQFSFAKASLSPIKGTGQGLIYNKISGRPSIAFEEGRTSRGSTS